MYAILPALTTNMTSPATASILCVFSESPIVVSALEACLQQAEVCSHLLPFSRTDELIPAVAEAKPQVVLIDFEPRHIELLGEIHRISPASAIVLWVREISTELAYEALHAGVRGIVSKTVGARQLAESVAKVAGGELCLDQGMSAQLLTMTPIRLSKRESNLLTLIAQGLKNKEIATALDLSEGTVRIYLSHLYQKVGAKDRYELALFALKHLALGRRRGEQEGQERVPSGGQHVIFRRLAV
jgi:DNA-binding NarL/FixJ family response regulator